MSKTGPDDSVFGRYSYNAANQLTNQILNDDGDLTVYDYGYDKNGNLVQRLNDGDPDTNYTYDYENRLVEVLGHQGDKTTYTYDGDGNRLAKLLELPAVTKEKGKRPQIGGNQGVGGQDNGGGRGNGRGNGYSLTADEVPSLAPLGSLLPQGFSVVDTVYGNGNGNGYGNGNGNGGNNGNGNGGNNGNGNNGLNGNGNGSGNGNKGDYEHHGDWLHTNNGKHLGWLNGKHLGWYKNGKLDKILLPPTVELVNYVNDVAQPASQVLMTYDANGNYKAAYAYGLERTKVDFLDDSRPDSQEPLYYLYDGLGSVSQLMMPAGNIRARFNYDPFGVPVTGGHLPIDNYNVLNNPFGYTGQQHDQETGFVYLRARYYDPSIGRFISQDAWPASIGNPQTLNRYAYVVNNPLRFLDPLGLCIDAGTINGTTGSTQVSISSQNENTPPVVTGAYYNARYGANEKIYEYLIEHPVEAKAGLRLLLSVPGILDIATAPESIEMDEQIIEETEVESSTIQGAGEAEVTITNDILGKPRVGSALKLDDYHAFNDIIDNYAGEATKTDLNNGATLYQVEGSLNGVSGRFEWITQNGNVTHRMFVPGGTSNGVPIKP